MTRPDNIATFPACPHCNTASIPPVPDGPICFRIAGGPAQTIPRSQAAQLLRFLRRMWPERVVGDHIYIALGRCLQASRAVATLRNKWKIAVKCETTPKVTKSGVYGLFSLPEGVEVWEPETARAPDATREA